MREPIIRPVYVASDNILTSLGFSTHEVMRNVERGLTGFRFIDDRSLSPVRLPLSLVDSGALEKAFRAVLEIRHPGSKASEFTRLEKMFIVSIHDALVRTKLRPADPGSFLILSSTKGNIDLLEAVKQDFPDPDRILLWKMADCIASFFGFINRPEIVSNACISGVLAISLASRLIESGSYDHIVVSGGDLLTEFVISGFQSFQALSPEPCRPFDLHRNGLSLGEGCATMILTSEKGKPGEICIGGSSSSNDANHISGPSRTGEELALSIGNALREAQLEPKEVSYVSAHGTATLFNDEMESKALGIAGLKDAPVNSFKGYWGHTLGAAGMVESVATVHSLRNDRLYRSEGYSETGVPIPINVIREHRQAQVRNGLKIASGFGGCNAAVVFRKS